MSKTTQADVDAGRVRGTITIKAPVLTEALIELITGEMQAFVGEPLTAETGERVAQAIGRAFMRHHLDAPVGE